MRTALRRLGKSGMTNHHGGGELLGVFGGWFIRLADLEQDRGSKRKRKQIATVRRKSGGGGGGGGTAS